MSILTPARHPRVRVHIRWMIRRDIPAVLRIEGFTAEYPWKEDEFLMRLRERNCIGMVAELDDAILGFMVYEHHPTRYDLTNLAVHPDYVRHGIGTQLVEKMKDKLNPVRRTAIDVMVRETNLPAQFFLRDMGFRANRVSRGYYEDSREDGYEMRYMLGQGGSR